MLLPRYGMLAGGLERMRDLHCSCNVKQMVVWRLRARYAVKASVLVRAQPHNIAGALLRV